MATLKSKCEVVDHVFDMGLFLMEYILSTPYDSFYKEIHFYYTSCTVAATCCCGGKCCCGGNMPLWRQHATVAATCHCGGNMLLWRQHAAGRQHATLYNKNVFLCKMNHKVLDFFTLEWARKAPTGWTYLLTTIKPNEEETNIDLNSREKVDHVKQTRWGQKTAQKKHHEKDKSCKNNSWRHGVSWKPIVRGKVHFKMTRWSRDTAISNSRERKSSRKNYPLKWPDNSDKKRPTRS